MSLATGVLSINSTVGSCQAAQSAGTRSGASGSTMRGNAARSARTPERSVKRPSAWQSSAAHAAELSTDVHQLDDGSMNAWATSQSPPRISCSRNGTYGIHEWPLSDRLRSDSRTLLRMKWPSTSSSKCSDESWSNLHLVVGCTSYRSTTCQRSCSRSGYRWAQSGSASQRRKSAWSAKAAFACRASAAFTCGGHTPSRITPRTFSGKSRMTVSASMVPNPLP